MSIKKFINLPLLWHFILDSPFYSIHSETQICLLVFPNFQRGNIEPIVNRIPIVIAKNVFKKIGMILNYVARQKGSHVLANFVKPKKLQPENLHEGRFKKHKNFKRRQCTQMYWIQFQVQLQFRIVWLFTK